MNTKTTLGILAVLTLLVGCATQPRGPAYGHEQEFRRQVGESAPVKGWGYKIDLIRFSADYQKAVVVFAVPDKTNVTEVVLEDDGFRRYRASVTDWARMERAKPTIGPGSPGFAKSSLAAWEKSSLAAISSGKASICVTFPDTRGPAYRHEPEFRRQIGESVPVKDWGFKIQELRFSGDSHKVLVVLAEPGKNFTHEVVLQDDGFRRYKGNLLILADPDDPMQPRTGVGSGWRGGAPAIIVTLPDK